MRQVLFAHAPPALPQPLLCCAFLCRDRLMTAIHEGSEGFGFA